MLLIQSKNKSSKFFKGQRALLFPYKYTIPPSFCDTKFPGDLRRKESQCSCVSDINTKFRLNTAESTVF